MRFVRTANCDPWVAVDQRPVRPKELLQSTGHARLLRSRGGFLSSTISCTTDDAAGSKVTEASFLLDVPLGRSFPNARARRTSREDARATRPGSPASRAGSLLPCLPARWAPRTNRCSPATNPFRGVAQRQPAEAADRATSHFPPAGQRLSRSYSPGRWGSAEWEQHLRTSLLCHGADLSLNR